MMSTCRRERAVGERQVHLPRPRVEAQAVGAREAFVAVGARHEVLAEAGAPAWGVRDGVGDRAQVQAARLFAATRMAKVLSKPSGGPTSTPNFSAYSRLTCS